MLIVLCDKAYELLTQCAPVHQQIAKQLVEHGQVLKPELDALAKHDEFVALRATLTDGQMESEVRVNLRAVIQDELRAVPQPLAPPPTQGRNERCACGSGRKYKQCHGGPNPPS